MEISSDVPEGPRNDSSGVNGGQDGVSSEESPSPEGGGRDLVTGPEGKPVGSDGAQELAEAPKTGTLLLNGKVFEAAQERSTKTRATIEDLTPTVVESLTEMLRCVDGDGKPDVPIREVAFSRFLELLQQGFANETRGFRFLREVWETELTHKERMSGGGGAAEWMKAANHEG